VGDCIANRGGSPGGEGRRGDFAMEGGEFTGIPIEFLSLLSGDESLKEPLDCNSNNNTHKPHKPHTIKSHITYRQCYCLVFVICVLDLLPCHTSVVLVVAFRKVAENK
jgi:hypothetical protein